MFKLVTPHEESFTPVKALESQGTGPLAKAKTLPTMRITSSETSFHKTFDQ